MLTKIDPSFVDETVQAAVSKKNIFGAVLCVENGENTFSHLLAAGNLTPNQPYFIASVTKLYVTAILLKLKSENQLELHNKISDYFSNDILQQLHVYKGKDYSKE